MVMFLTSIITTLLSSFIQLQGHDLKIFHSFSLNSCRKQTPHIFTTEISDA